MVRLLAATRLLLERRNFLLATTLASRALATTSPQLQLRPGEATSDDEKTIYFVRHAEGYHNKGERELPNWKSDNLGLDPKYRDARLTPAGVAQSQQLNADLRKRSVPPPVPINAPPPPTRTKAAAERSSPGNRDHRQNRAAAATDNHRGSTMQFTPQQLAGGSSYMCKTKVGNWLEDMCLQEEKLSEFARNRDEGSSLMYNVMGKRNLYHTKVPLAPRAGSTIRFGDVIMLGHPSTGGVLGVDLTEPCLDANRDQKLVTAAMPGVEPEHCARYSYILEPTDSATQLGDDLHFGEPVFLRCHDLLVLDEALGATRPPFYLASQLKNDRNGSRVSNQQTVFATDKRSMAAAWTFEKISANTGVVRQLSGGEAVPCGTGLNGPTVVVQHKTTRTALAASVKNWDSTDFGRELEVTCHNHLGQNKVNALVSEMAGKTTGQTNVRLEKSPNFWCVIGDVEGAEQPPQPELPGMLNADQMVALLQERVAAIEGAGERLVALAEAAPGSNIDREDVAYELADIGLGFDPDATKTLLDAFDEGDGMIPINHFLDAALAQVAE